MARQRHVLSERTRSIVSALIAADGARAVARHVGVSAATLAALAGGASGHATTVAIVESTFGLLDEEAGNNAVAGDRAPTHTIK